jgi:queuine tRNA-ribosyltransferase
LLQPGPKVVADAGGLHKFINRKSPLITDSGGFQVFSLAYGGVADELKSRGAKKHAGAVLKIDEEGVLFRSYRDGAKVLLTPESSIEAQKAFGADIIIPLDELPPYHFDPKELVKSLERTHRWEKRSLETHLANPAGQAMYAVVHGGLDKELRARSIDTLSELPFDGFSIGGSIGKDRADLIDLLRFVMPRLPETHPNHLLGVGDVPSITDAVPLGVDTFDSSYPMRSARHGVLLTREGTLKVGATVHANSHGPVEEGCECSTCQNYSLAYVHHLFKAHEMAGMTLATIHNLHFMVRMMARMRELITLDQL